MDGFSNPLKLTVDTGGVPPATPDDAKLLFAPGMAVLVIKILLWYHVRRIEKKRDILLIRPFWNYMGINRLKQKTTNLGPNNFNILTILTLSEIPNIISLISSDLLENKTETWTNNPNISTMLF